MTICMLGGMDMIIRLIFELIIKINIIKIYFPEPGSHTRDKIKVDVDLCSYATKVNLKEQQMLDTSKLKAKADLAR